MAITIPGSTTRVVGVEEFIDYVHTEVDLRDQDSVLAAAPMFRGLSNDRELVVGRLNEQVKSLFKNQAMPSAQSIFLGKGEDFYLRANVWPSTADLASGRVYQNQFAYDMAHDHNYSFLTVGYLGPGYLTDIYEYDHDKLQGYPGEPVEMRFLEHVHFTAGMTMYYRASKDLHLQHPADDLSISLNMMIFTPEVRFRDQYFFDLERKVLLDYPAEMDSSRRISMLRLAATAGDANTLQLIADLARAHPCKRTRLTAFETQARLNPSAQAEVWKAASRDTSALVAEAARRHLAALED